MDGWMDGSDNSIDHVWQIIGDLSDDAAIHRALEGASKVICAAGAHEITSMGYLIWGGKSSPNSPNNVDFMGVQKLAKAAAAHGVDHFVLISSICVTKPRAVVAMLMNCLMSMSMKWKLEGERALRESGVSYTIVSFKVIMWL